jgi:ketosteroid isomerase-like protein
MVESTTHHIRNRESYMRNPCRILPSIALAALALATTTSHAAASDDQAVVHVLEAVTHAIEKHDLASVDDLWIADATFSVIDNGDASYGDWKSFREHTLTPELEPMKHLTFELLNVRPHVVGSLAWITYEYRIKAEVKDRPMLSEGAATLVLRRVKNNWLATHVNISSKREEETHDGSPPKQH